MIKEKVFKICTYSNTDKIDQLVLELADEINKGYHIACIHRNDDWHCSPYVEPEPNICIILRKDRNR